jgi:hypothetical protein
MKTPLNLHLVAFVGELKEISSFLKNDESFYALKKKNFTAATRKTLSCCSGRLFLKKVW